MSHVMMSEAILATIGIEPILSRRVERFTADKLRKALTIESRIYALAGKLARGTLEPDVESPPINYDRILKDLTTPWDAQQVQDMLAAFPPAMSDAVASFLPLASHAVDFMKSQFPVQTHQTVLGPVNVTPPDIAVGRFEVILGVINDPLSVFPLMVNGALLRRQVLAVQAIYPTMAQCMLEGLADALAKEKARKASYHLTYAIEHGISTFLGKQTVPQSLKESLQAPSMKPGGNPGPKNNGVQSQQATAEEGMTTSQRASVPLHR